MSDAGGSGSSKKIKCPDITGNNTGNEIDLTFNDAIANALCNR
jgi:hypothetical protein